MYVLKYKVYVCVQVKCVADLTILVIAFSRIRVLRYMPSGQRDHIPTPRPMLLSWKHKVNFPRRDASPSCPPSLMGSIISHYHAVLILHLCVTPLSTY